MKSIQKIGNSYGIIIPKQLLEKYDLRDRIDLIETEEGLLIKRVKNPREGWAEAFRKAVENDEIEYIPDILDDDVFEEY